MKNPDRPYRGFFDYSRPQQFALGLVGLLVLLCYGLGKWYPFQPPTFVADAALVAQAQSFHLANAEPIADVNKAPESFPFNPNTVTEEELIRLGLRPDQASSWLRYRGDRTNTFKRPKDIAKLYKLDSTDVARLLPLVVLDKQMANEVARFPASDYKQEKPAYEQFFFDPNTVNQAELERLGLSKKRAAGFLKYRAKAPPFRSATDLDRLRLLDQETKDRLKPLVRIETTSPSIAGNTDQRDNGYSSSRGSVTGSPTTYGDNVATPQPYQPREAVALASVDINTATSLALQEIRGIGPYWSDRILKFRAILGGFSSIDQLGSMYGFPDSTFQAIKPYLLLEAPISRKLKINSISADALSAHPYLSKKQAVAIVNYRKNHGAYRSLEELSAVRILNADDLLQLRPYLDFEE